MQIKMLLGAVLWLLVGLGCSHYEAASFNKPDGLNGHEILLVPFRESRRRLWYTESQFGQLIVTDLRAWAYEEADDPLFVEEGTEQQVLQTIRNDEKWLVKDRITASDWNELVGSLGVRFVLVGDIKELKLRDPSVIGLYKPKMEVNIEVYDAVRGKKVYGNTLEVTDPTGRSDPLTDLASFDKDPAMVRRLVRRAAERIGQELYGYYR